MTASAASSNRVLLSQSSTKLFLQTKPFEESSNLLPLLVLYLIMFKVFNHVQGNSKDRGK